jgi:PAS domain S-box-containing protein
MMKQEQNIILIVEDEAIIALSIKMSLEKWGYSVLIAGTGEKAVELAKTGAPIDLALMDIDLGKGMDGPQAAAAILKMRSLPIIFHTSHSEREMVDKVRDITRYGYILKGCGEFVLRSSLDMAFELYDSHMDLKRKSEALYEHAQLLDNILEHFPGSVFWKDKDFRYLGCNKNFAQAAGLDEPGKIVGLQDGDLPWGSHETLGYLADDREVLESRKSKLHIEETQHTADGSVVWYDTSKVPLLDSVSQAVGVFGVSTDITRYKNFELELCKLSLVLEQSPAAIIITDKDGNIELTNPRFQILTGYGLEEVVGKSPRFLRSGQTNPSVHQEMWDTISSGHEWRGRFINRKKDGTIYHESAMISPVKDAQGQIVNYIAIKDAI